MAGHWFYKLAARYVLPLERFLFHYFTLLMFSKLLSHEKTTHCKDIHIYKKEEFDS